MITIKRFTKKDNINNTTKQLTDNELSLIQKKYLSDKYIKQRFEELNMLYKNSVPVKIIVSSSADIKFVYDEITENVIKCIRKSIYYHIIELYDELIQKE